MLRWCWVNFQCRGRPTTWITVGQGPIALAVGAGGGGLDIFTLIYPFSFLPLFGRGWSGGAMVLGKLPVPRRPTIWITVGQGPTTLVVGAGGGSLDIFTHLSFSLLFLPLFGRRPDID